MITIERGGARIVWPDLDAPWYADPAAAVERLALKGWRQGGMTPDAPTSHASAAGRYLAADVTYLRTLMGQMEPLDAIVAYDRALRAAPAFADAPRALVMIGFTSLRLGLAPEADTAFARVSREYSGSAYADVAALGRATALRARRRFDEARQALVGLGIPPALGCDVLLEEAALARDTGAHGAAVVLDERLARGCPRFDGVPGTLLDRATSLVAIGRRADARALLVGASEPLDPDARAPLLMRAAELAREDGELDAARAVLEHALGTRIDGATRTMVQARLARLDGAVAPARAIARLDLLATTAPTRGTRLDVVGVAAETLADAGRFGEALARLALPDDAPGEDADRQRVRRDAVLARWIDQRARANDAAGVVTVYAGHRAAIDTRAGAATARQVAGALTQVGLADAGLRLLRLRDPGDDPAHALAIAEAALAAHDTTRAREALARMDAGARRAASTSGSSATSSPASLEAERKRLAARLAAADGQPDTVAPDVVASDATVARDVALAWTARAAAAADAGAVDAAADAYARAQSLAPDPASRLVAIAGLVATRPNGPGAADPDALAALDETVVDRALRLLAATRDVALAPAGPLPQGAR